MNRRVQATTLIMLFAAATLSAADLDFTTLHRALQFNFSNPGARSLGMGGAFIGRADDASAAEANPAGLTIIGKSEMTIELRSLDYGQDIPTGIFGTSSAGTMSVSNRRTTPTFLSLAFPSGNGAYSIYYHRPLDYDQSASLANGAGVTTTIGPIRGFIGDLPGNFALHYRAETFGFASAWKSGGLSIGATVRYQRFRANSSFALSPVTVSAEGNAVPAGPPAIFGALNGKDSATTYSGGLKWANPSQNLSVGLVYKSGADFDVNECSLNNAGDACTSSIASKSSFAIPTQMGAGISIRPFAGLTINGDAVKVKYSRLMRDYVPGSFCAATAPAPCLSAAQLGFHLDDATEIHVGGEYLLTSTSVPIAFRGGWWHDPSHAVTYSGPATDSTNIFIDGARRWAAERFNGGSAQNHVSIGIGFLGKTFEINAAYDHSDNNKTASISALKRF